MIVKIIVCVGWHMVYTFSLYDAWYKAHFCTQIHWHLFDSLNIFQVSDCLDDEYIETYATYSLDATKIAWQIMLPLTNNNWHWIVIKIYILSFQIPTLLIAPLELININRYILTLNQAHTKQCASCPLSESRNKGNIFTLYSVLFYRTQIVF